MRKHQQIYCDDVILSITIERENQRGLSGRNKHFLDPSTGLGIGLFKLTSNLRSPKEF